MRNRGCCYVSDNLHEHVDLSSLLTKLVPVFSSHAEWVGFAESWHFTMCGGNKLGDSRQEEVRHLCVSRGCKTRVGLCVRDLIT